MSTQHPDYTEDDFNILAMGEWNPDDEAAESVAEEKTEPAHEIVETEAAEQEAAETEVLEAETETTPAGEQPQTDPETVEEETSDAEEELASGNPPAQPAETNPWEDEWDPASDIEDGEPDLARVELMPGGVKAAIEAILSVAQTPVTVRELAANLIVPEHTVEVALDQLHREYKGYDDGVTVHEPRGMELRRTAGGWRLYARSDFAPWVGRHVKTQQTAKLPKSAMETLSVIAYQQPITKGHVSAIRGANSESSFKALLLHGLITETTPDEDGIAQFATTPEFLERMGLNSLAELPPLAPYLPDVEDVGLMGEQP